MTKPILLDTNILPDISRGNARAATALLNYINNGTPVYISHAAYEELVTRAPNPQLQAHYREMLRELGIQIAPPGPLAERVQLYEDNITHQPGRGQPGSLREYDRRNDPTRPGDMFVAAQARAIRARLWTFDEAVIRRAPQFGVELAPECSIGGLSSAEDPSVGRRLLRLPAIVVTANGTVIRRPPGSGGSGGSSPPPVAPSGGATGGGGRSSGGASGSSSARGVQATTGVPDMRLPPTGGPSARGQGIAAGIELLFRGINAVCNWLNDREQQDRLRRDLNAHAAAINGRDPMMGVLVVIYYQVFEPVGTQRDSLIQPGPVYSHLEIYYGRTDSEARQLWRSTRAIRPAGTRGQEVWFPPQRPTGALSLQSPFLRLQLATFIAGKEKVQGVEWGGVNGFDDTSQEDLAGGGGAIHFHVLQPPRQIEFLNGQRLHTVDIPIVERAAGGGNTTLLAVDLDPVLGWFMSQITAVPVFPANEEAERLFRSVRPTHDNLGQLKRYTNIRLMRWVRPEHIDVLG